MSTTKPAGSGWSRLPEKAASAVLAASLAAFPLTAHADATIAADAAADAAIVDAPGTGSAAGAAPAEGANPQKAPYGYGKAEEGAEASGDGALESGSTEAPGEKPAVFEEVAGQPKLSEAASEEPSFEESAAPASEEPAVLSADIPVDAAHFPDPALRSYIASQFGTALDIDETSRTNTLVVSGLGISSLQGIEYFPNLIKLQCLDNNLTSVSLGGLRALRTLSCSDNRYLTSIDVSGNPELTVLSANNCALTSLDVSANAKLESLVCENNYLTSIDVTHNPKLTTLLCQKNDLSSIDVSGNPELLELRYHSPRSTMATLDFRSNPKLQLAYHAVAGEAVLLAPGMRDYIGCDQDPAHTGNVYVDLTPYYYTELADGSKAVDLERVISGVLIDQITGPKTGLYNSGNHTLVIPAGATYGSVCAQDGLVYQFNVPASPAPLPPAATCDVEFRMRPSSPYNEWFLPDEVLALAPESITVEPGASLVPGVTPGFPADLPRVKVDSDGGGVVDGGWVFDRWFVPPAAPDPSTLTVVQGYWRFVPLSQAWYEFRLATPGKSLPDAVRALEPEAVGGLFLDEALALRPADVEDVAFDEDGDGSADGTWVFGSWSLENEAPEEGRSAHWIGTWTWEPAGAPPAGETRVAKPSAEAGLVYSGASQRGVPTGVGYTLSGTAAAKAAGDYTATATLLPGYAWEDGTTEPVVLAWSIAKAQLTAAYTGQTVLTTDPEPALGVAVTGFVGGEDASTATGYAAPMASLPGAWPLAAGDYPIAPAGGSADNYTFTYVPGTLKVEEPAPPAKLLPGKGALASTGDGLGGVTAVAGTAAAAVASALLVARRKGRDTGGGESRHTGNDR